MFHTLLPHCITGLVTSLIDHYNTTRTLSSCAFSGTLFGWGCGEGDNKNLKRKYLNFNWLTFLFNGLQTFWVPEARHSTLFHLQSYNNSTSKGRNKKKYSVRKESFFKTIMWFAVQTHQYTPVSRVFLSLFLIYQINKRGLSHKTVTPTLWTKMVRMTSIVNVVKIPFRRHLFMGLCVLSSLVNISLSFSK